ncbi:MAG: GTP cyclohydrolase 1 [Candidatus Scalindua sp.]|nr:MAG: GTP cyclohydrolase 1 [Candidatus Scalindua sp.]
MSLDNRFTPIKNNTIMDKQKIMKATKLLLEGIGEDPSREGLLETPRRVAEMCEEIFSGIGADSGEQIKILQSEDHDEIVLLKDIPFFSVCEHHLLPFIGKAHVAYIPNGNRVTGLSKLARVVDTESKKLQMQERLTTAIANSIMNALQPKGAMAIVEAEHLCMTMRGIKKPGTITRTSVVRGIFRESLATRTEAMSLIMGR